MFNLIRAVRKYKDQIVKIGFFNASITNLDRFQFEIDKCKSCHEEKSLFVANPNLNPVPESICIDCLKTIDIEITHRTKFGFVDADLPKGLEDAKLKVSRESFSEMLKTPPYLTLQGENWLCHCKDFMEYIGRWEAPDFTNESNDANGKKLFLEMTNKDYQHLWEESELPDNEKEYTWGDVFYHTFECRHCKIKQGYWEA
ncbi:MAG: CbrC family protein [Saprospiraceae bacterium]